MTILCVGCAGVSEVPVKDRSTVSQKDVPNTSYKSDTSATGVHIVRSGDTLFSIAWDAGLDFKSLAQWNNIPPPYVIHPGQKIKKTAPRLHTSKNSTILNSESAKKPAVKAEKPAETKKNGASSGWTWPAEGPVLSGFSAAGGNKGIDIGGTTGRDVRAAASGKVVYAGSGLRGYGKLIIVKHDEVFLSAYAHNSKLLIEDGEQVTKGQQIALMGDTGTDRVKLHFEIRQKGKPVNPLKYLPKRQ